MARSLATADGRYSHDEVLAAYLAPGMSIDARFELRDRYGNVVRDLTGVVEDATIQLNADQEVRGSCNMILQPVEEVLGRPYQFRVACFLRIGPMGDGGWAENSAGIYVVSDVERTISVGPEGAEEDDAWALTMGDQQMILEGSPPVEGFSVTEGERVTSGVKRALQAAGITDVGGVVNSDEVFEQSLRWTTKRGAQRRVRKSNRAYNRALRRYYQRVRKGKRARPPKRYKWKEAQESPETWNAILEDMADGIGYDPGYFDLDGVYRFHPARNVAAEPPDFSYVAAGSNGVLIDDLVTTPNQDGLANRVKARQTNPNNKVKVAEADLNELLPNHPLAQHHHGIYFDLPLDENTSGSQDALQRRAERTLLDNATYYTTARLVTAALPLHLIPDIYGITLPGVTGFSGEEAWQGVGWALNLFGEPMEHDVRRSFREVS